jgi:hypothetical protein
MEFSKDYKEQTIFLVDTNEGPVIYSKNEFVGFVKKIKDNYEKFNLAEDEFNNFLNNKVTDAFVTKDGYLI